MSIKLEPQDAIEYLTRELREKCGRSDITVKRVNWYDGGKSGFVEVIFFASPNAGGEVSILVKTNTLNLDCAKSYFEQDILDAIVQNFPCEKL